MHDVFLSVQTRLCQPTQCMHSGLETKASTRCGVCAAVCYSRIWSFQATGEVWRWSWAQHCRECHTANNSRGDSSNAFSCRSGFPRAKEHKVLTQIYQVLVLAVMGSLAWLCKLIMLFLSFDAAQ